MVAVLELEEEHTPRQEIVEWLRAERDRLIDEGTEILLPKLTDAAVAYFRGDARFLQRLGMERLRPDTYNLAQRVLAETRSNPRVVTFNGRLVPLDEFRKRIEKKAERWQTFWRDWMEHAGDRHYSLESMDRQRLLVAAGERRTRGAVQIARATFLESLATQLQGDETVADHFTDDELWGEYWKVYGGGKERDN